MTIPKLNSFKETIKNEFPEQFLKDWEDLSSWSSMQMLLIMTAINDEYNILISHEDFTAAKTIEGLYQIVLAKNS
tara:strand:+ start:183 stop:407 length:225 start_codon:yes stop_codon:yes gene_type:complete